MEMEGASGDLLSENKKEEIGIQLVQQTSETEINGATDETITDKNDEGVDAVDGLVISEDKLTSDSSKNIESEPVENVSADPCEGNEESLCKETDGAPETDIIPLQIGSSNLEVTPGEDDDDELDLLENDAEDTKTDQLVEGYNHDQTNGCEEPVTGEIGTEVSTGVQDEQDRRMQATTTEDDVLDLNEDEDSASGADKTVVDEVEKQDEVSTAGEGVNQGVGEETENKVDGIEEIQDRCDVTERKDEGMEIAQVTEPAESTNGEQDDNLLNTDMEGEPETGDSSTMETENESNVEMVQDFEASDETAMENFEIEKTNDESEEITMENEEVAKDVEMADGDNVTAEEKVDHGEQINMADISMETTEEKENVQQASGVEDETVVSEIINQEQETGAGGLIITQVQTIANDQESVDEVGLQGETTADGDQENEDKVTTTETTAVDIQNTAGDKSDNVTEHPGVIDEEDKIEGEKLGEKQTDSSSVENKEKEEESTEKIVKPKDTRTNDIQIIQKPKEEDDIQVIDLDAEDSDGEKDASKTIKQEKGDSVEGKNDGLGIQIASVSGAVNVPKETLNNVKTEIKDVKTESKPVISVKQEIKQESKVDLKSAKSKIQKCIVCKKMGKCKYNIVRNGDIKHLCDDECFKRFRSNPTTFLRTQSPVQQEAKTVGSVNNQHGQYKTCQVCQVMNINASSSKPFLNWQGMDFCGEDCLGKFQGNLNTSCSQCSNAVLPATKGKFCLKFGNQIRQLCSQTCYNEFTKHQKLCECCQKDISKSADAFVAAAGADGAFKDFCSQACLQKFEEKSNRDVEITGVDAGKRGTVVPKGTHTCSVCSKVSTMKHQVQLEGKSNYLCSDPCFSAFQYANKLTMNTCDNCGVYCYNEGMHPQYIQFEGQQKRFCSFMCVNAFKTTNKKIVSCSWCNCKKSNFDMIERVDANNKYQLFCSLNCLSLYRVNLQATSNQAVMCDQCKRYVPAQYHLTMSDASVRNFCSYTCVMNFQSQFTNSNSAATQQKNIAPKGGMQTRSTNRPTQPPPPPPPPAQKAPQNPVRTPTSVQQNAPRPPPVQNRPTNPNMNSIPIISNVVSLAPQGNQQQQVNFKSNQQIPLVINNKNANIRTTVPPQPQQTVIIQPPQPKTVKNKSCLCKPFVQTKATSCRPHTQTKETQTDKDMEPKSVLIPIPIPFYVPVPMAMYSQPTPTPFPFPIPIPIPCFIPTTKKNSSSILKQIKEIREKIPDDPLEAELLMMAEAVSANAKDSSDSEGDKSDAEMDTAEEPEKPSGELGEDMLEMALRMATEMTSEPVMDLEETIDPVPVNTEPPPKLKPEVEENEDEEDDEEYTPVRETRSKGKGTKRSGGHSRRRSKRHKAPIVIKMAESPAPEEPEPVVEPPPDANMYLKYTYGVNAWKHWVVQKNNQLDKVSKQGSGKLKLFKTDMLQCSADELNYSLCLFVKEVRKPNGEEYAPDSIYYLCLGIQMFLFENERIDNIFTDIYYEKFTECLNEVLQRYTPKVNAAGQIVCRIEEEHLWECKQLGAHSPHVLLNTLVYFNTKYFQLKTPDDHLKLSFTHIMKHWKKSPVGKGNAQGRSVYLRYYCPAPVRPATDGNRKKKEELPVFEQAENLDNPLRCPVKLYEFYLSKCPESIKNRSDAFYLVPERSCVPDSPVWYSTQNLQIEAMNKMLNRTMLVREIQESFVHTQPIFA